MKNLDFLSYLCPWKWKLWYNCNPWRTVFFSVKHHTVLLILVILCTVVPFIVWSIRTWREILCKPRLRYWSLQCASKVSKNTSVTKSHLLNSFPDCISIPLPLQLTAEYFASLRFSWKYIWFPLEVCVRSDWQPRIRRFTSNLVPDPNPIQYVHFFNKEFIGPIPSERCFLKFCPYPRKSEDSKNICLCFSSSYCPLFFTSINLCDSCFQSNFSLEIIFLPWKSYSIWN